MPGIATTCMCTVWFYLYYIICCTYRTFSNRTKLLINRRKSILHVFLNNTHHTGNTYIIIPNIFSMEALALINRRKSILHVFLNNTHHTGNTYVITPNVLSMEALALINRINSLFAIYVALIERKGDLKLFFSIFDPFYLRKYS